MSAPRGNAPLDEALEVNRFWFGPAPHGLHTIRDREKLWFGASTAEQHQGAIDEMIRERFGELMRRAASGELAGWAGSPRRRLALILLLDQFPRNAFRGTARAFATDAAALALALSGIQAAADAPLSPIERIFLCMPLQHAERLDVQEESAPRDLAPGEKVTGVIGIKGVDLNQPRLYQLNFGIDRNRPVTAEAVL